jgi:nucleoside-diphosphate-sugar epimerase
VITVLGAAGFIGSHLVEHLARTGLDHWAPARGEAITGRDLGHVIDCIGLTGDFRERPHDAAEAHVGRLIDLVRDCMFDSLLYLSSTRVYRYGTGREDDPIGVRPEEADQLYDLTKLAGEAIVHALGDRGRVARLSHVYGPGQGPSFLASVLDAAPTGRVHLQTSLDSTHDFVSVRDVTPLLVRIALEGTHRTYNVASGIDVTNAELVDALGCVAEVQAGAPVVRPPAVDISRVRDELGFAPARILEELRCR